MHEHFFAYQAIDGSWHVVYRVPKTAALHSVAQHPCRAAAQRDAARLNDEQRADIADRAAAAASPAVERRPAHDWYDYA